MKNRDESKELSSLLSHLQCSFKFIFMLKGNRRVVEGGESSRCDRNRMRRKGETGDSRRGMLGRRFSEGHRRSTV